MSVEDRLPQNTLLSRFGRKTFGGRAAAPNIDAIGLSLVGMLVSENSLLLSMLKVLRPRLHHDWHLVQRTEDIECAIIGSEATLDDEERLPHDAVRVYL
ncbi:MAG: hypothetical protein ACRCWJ_07640, partial [Casimicrobium sp.]